MKNSAAQARLHLQLGSSALPVLALEGEEALCEPFKFKIELLVAPGFSVVDNLALPGVITIVGKDGACRELAGVITALEETGTHHDGQLRVLAHLESHLALLRQQSDTRIILGKSVVEIATELLQTHGFPSTQIQFQLTRDYPVRPFTLQANETDLDFLHRILSAAGIFYWSDIEEGTEVVHFCDHNGQLPFSDRKVVRYQPPAGMEATLAAVERTGILSLEFCQSMTPAEFHIHDRSETQPALAIAGSAHTNAKPGDFKPVQTHFGTGAQGPEQARAQAQLLAQRAAVEAFTLTITSDMPDLGVGQVLSLDASLLTDELSGDYLPMRVHHRASQRAGADVAGEELAYTNQARMIRRETPFRAAMPPRPQLPMTFTARIESGGAHAHLDEAGRYRVRAHFDREPRAHTEASIPIRRLSPYGGPAGAEPTGLHQPLQDGAEVLLSCLNGDPDRPMIVGTLPNPANFSPVTSANAAQNRLRTAADNELCLDDQIEREAITLRTFGGHNILHLDASAVGHKIRLASEQGALQLQAKKTLHVQSDSSITELVGDDRVQIVENRHQTATSNGEIHHQAATNYQQSAANNIRMHAGANIEQTSGRHLRIDVEQSKQVTVEEGRASFTVQDGNLTIQSAKDIRISGKGGGDIHFGQAGGGFIIKADGTVQLYGNKVSLGSGEVNLNGKVNYEIGGGAPMPEAAVGAPLVPQGIPELNNADEPAIYNLAWSHCRVPVGETTEALFSVKNFKGDETAIVNVYECGDDGQKRIVDSLSASLDDGFGQHQIKWLRTPKQVSDDLIRDKGQEEMQTLMYVFEVEIDDVRSEPSSGLHLTASISLSPQYSDGTSLAEGVEVTLKDAQGKNHFAQVVQGEVSFVDVIVGPWRWQIPGEPFEFDKGDLS
ncbi:MAG: type VI secretion system tip protein TssI/VgrG [Desulfuromonadaceae bacterium]|nr:type VI secretion system tip protein TssI/VgrG [Desulfuromonadaceae bacterium]